jgi:transcriptional regulator with XRE-family HTH domain
MISEERLYRLLGERLRKLRKRAGTTQAELAAQVGLERTSITNIEKGTQKVPLHVLFRLCEVFRVQLSELVPPVSEVQEAKVEPPLESVTFGDQVVKIEPRLKEAIASVLNTN